MRSTGTLLAAFAASLLFAAPARAQDDQNNAPFDRACMDDYGRNLCDQGEWSEIVKNLGLRPAELLQREGFRGVRVFTVDGYARDMPAITILAQTFGADDQPRDAKLTVHWETFRGAEKAEYASLVRSASSDQWRRAMDLQILAAQAPERQPEQVHDGDQVTICLHAWVTVTESLGDSGVLRRVRHACGDDELFAASFEMAAAAVNAFPECELLDPARYRNASTRLRRCFTLHGVDKSAAASVLNILDGDVDEPSNLVAYLAPDVVLSLPDRRALSGAAAVAEVLAAPALAETTFYWNTATGESDGVTTTGSINRDLDDGYEAASFAATWGREGSTWRITEIAIGVFKTFN